MEITSIQSADANFTVGANTCPVPPKVLAADEACSFALNFAPKIVGNFQSSIQVNFKSSDSKITTTSSTLSVAGSGAQTATFAGISSIDGITTSSAQINWARVTGSIRYLVFRVSASNALTLITDLDATQSSYTVSGLSSGTNYTFIVHAVDKAGIRDPNTRNVSITTKNLGSFSTLTDKSTNEGTASTQLLSCSDEYASSPSFNVTVTDFDANCSVVGTTLSCTPSYKTGHASWTSSVSVTCSLNGTTYARSFTLSVTDTNRAPALNTISNQTVSATSAISSVNATEFYTSNDTDRDTDTLLYACTFSGGGFSAGTACTSLPNDSESFNTATGVFAWTPSHLAAPSGAQTVYTIVVTASDQQSSPLTNSVSFTITVNPATPVVSNPSNQVFPSSALLVGNSFTYNFSNSNYADDSGVASYACSYDRIVDDAVSSGSNCSTLSGLTFNTSNGSFAWTPDNSAIGAYEFKVTATNVSGTGSRIFLIDIQPGYVTSNLRGYWDAQFANYSSPYLSSNNTWRDLTGNGYHGTNSDSTHAAWSGSSPYRLTYDGSGYTDFGSSVLGSQTKVLFTSWITPSNVALDDRVIFGTSNNNNGTGFTVTQYGSKVELITGSNYSTTVTALSPTSYWRFAEGVGITDGGTALDSSGNGRNLSYVGGVSSTTAVVRGDSADGATLFNGTTGYITGASSAAWNFGTSNFSISLWVKFNSGVGTQILLAKDDAYGALGNKWLFYYDGNLRFNINAADNSIAGGGGSSPISYTWTPTSSTWYHLVVTRNGGSGDYKLYINGTNVQTNNDTNAIPDSTANLDIGNNNTNQLLNGVLDEVAIFPSVLSDSDVTNLYDGIRGIRCTSNSNLVNGQPVMVSGLLTGANVSLYINGIQESTIANASSITPSTNLRAGSGNTGSYYWPGAIHELKVYGTSNGSAVGTSSTVKTNFDVTADRYRETPLGNIVTNGLVFHLDAANYSRGLAFGGTGCGITSWFDLGTLSATATLSNFSGCGSSSGFNGDGTASNPYRLTFDGTDDIVTFSDSGFPSGSAARTYSSWFATSYTGADQYLFDYGNIGTGRFLIALESGTGRLIAGQGGSEIHSTQTNLSNGSWHNLVVTFDGSNYAIYIDGVADSSGTTTINTNLLQGSVGAATNNLVFLNGSIPNTMLYNRSISSSEVTQNCNALKSRFSGATCN